MSIGNYRVLVSKLVPEERGEKSGKLGGKSKIPRAATARGVANFASKGEPRPPADERGGSAPEFFV